MKKIQGSLFGYLGGKSRVAKQILTYMADHKVYVEPFFGSGAIFFKKGYKQVSNNTNYREVIGDLDYNVVNFFEQLRINYTKMKEKLKYFEYSESLYKKSHTESEYYNNSDNLTKACFFFFNILSSFSCRVNRGFAYGRKSKNNVKSFNNKIDLLDIYAERLKDCFIFHKSYDILIDRFDTKDTLFYLDPPYINTIKYNIQKENLFDYDNFVKKVKSIKGKFILSHYKSDWLLNNFKNYLIIDIKHTPSVARSNGEKRYVKEGSNECIVLNYDPKTTSLYTGKSVALKNSDLLF